MSNQIEEIELKTEAVNELLETVPRWIVRWGISLIFVIILLALSLSIFVKYPDRLSAKSVITTTNPPVTLVAKTSGKIAAIYIQNNQAVQKGDVLLAIDNSVNYQDVKKTAQLLTTLQGQLKSGIIPTVMFDSSMPMGELTPAFISCLKSYNDYKLQLQLHSKTKEIAIINQELTEYHHLQVKYHDQETIYNEELALTEKDYQRYQTLLKNGSISAKECEDKKREYLATKRNYESIKITNINNNLAIINLQKSKLQLEDKTFQENKTYELALNQNIQALKSQIEIWEQTYLLKAPIAGQVSLFDYWTTHQYIKQNDQVLTIIPQAKQTIIAKLFLPIQNSGKLKIGQAVNIKLDSYPYQEYGTLNGTVTSISPMPRNETYAIEVSLPGGLKTSYHKQLAYKEEMQGIADIITEELSVFERVFYQLRKILKK